LHPLQASILPLVPFMTMLRSIFASALLAAAGAKPEIVYTFAPE